MCTHVFCLSLLVPNRKFKFKKCCFIMGRCADLQVFVHLLWEIISKQQRIKDNTLKTSLNDG